MSYLGKPSKRLQILSKIILLLSITCYITSLLTNAFFTNMPNYGYQLLEVGWLGILEGSITWFANPIYYFSLLTGRWPKLSLISSALAFFIAGLFLLTFHQLYTSEGGSAGDIQYLAIGYYLWLTSMGLLTVNRIIRFKYLTNSKSTKSKDR